MKDCVVLAGDARDAKQAGRWAASCAKRARMTAEEGKALAVQVRDLYVEACKALFGRAQGDRHHGGAGQVLLSAEITEGSRPRFELCADGAVKCDAIGPKSDDQACDGLTCFKLA